MYKLKDLTYTYLIKESKTKLMLGGKTIVSFRDEKDSKSIEYETLTVKSGMVLTIQAPPYGGFSGIISKMNQ